MLHYPICQACPFFVWLIVLALCTKSQATISYDQQIRPILAEYCFQCHGPDASHREADLRLDLEESAKEHAISMTGESELLRRMVTEDDALRMPPANTGKKPTEKEVGLIRQWLAEGAVYEQHWAYRSLDVSKIPSLDLPAEQQPHSTSWVIDKLISQSLSERALALAKPLSRQQLIRRVSYDLTGLPPTWQEVEAFANDPSPDAYSQLINRLLESPAYGQRWGRHWLDLARYADTHGGAAIGYTVFPFSYTYRDYVIAAFNSDLPYNRFVLEQIAADQLGLDEHDPALAGLGFLTVGMQYRNRNDLIDDQIDVVTRGLMGLTVSCARCHDHKFDAIPTKDYYALYASLANSLPPETLPIVGSVSDSPETTEYRQKLQELQHRYDEMARDQIEIMRGRFHMQVGLYLREIAGGATEQDLSTQFLSYRTDDLRPLITNRWLTYLGTLGDRDPVFGPWHQLSRLESVSFAGKASELIGSLVKQNADAGAGGDVHALGAVAPKWNPRLLDSLVKKQPQSMLEVADAYGSLFAEIHQEWLLSLGQASQEGVSEESVVPDEDVKHVSVNSPVHRQLRWHLYGADTPTDISTKEAAKLLNRTVADSLSGKRGAIHELHLSSPGSPPRAMALKENVEQKDYFVFLRGNPLSRGELVRPGFLTALTPTESANNQPVYLDGKRRLGLANSIIDPENPLTRRVLVNWVWQHHFGHGLVRTADDFGTRGRAPSHPALLDYLAHQFAENGWSIKDLHRRILLTEVYQQASVENDLARTTDPENDLFWRMPRRRLDLEAMRDAMLFVSGELQTTLGGKPFPLSQNPAVPRRSVYGFINRDIVSNLSSTFDVANPNACTVKRPDTTVPQQTLFALNSEFVQDRAAKLSELSNAESGGDSRVRVGWIYRRLFSRNPTEEEIATVLQFVLSDQNVSEVAVATPATPATPAKSVDVWARLIHALLASNEFIFID
jgi:hypothetical protein